jgi:FkbH-like protein
MTTAQKISVALLSPFTPKNLEEPLTKALEARGFIPTVKTGGYDQYRQELIDPNSWLQKFKPNITAILQSTHSLFPTIDTDILINGYEATLTNCRERISMTLRAIESSGLDTRFIITTLEKPISSPIGMGDYSMPEGMHALIRACNDELIAYTRAHPNVTLIDLDKIRAMTGAKQMTEEKMYYLGKILFSKEAARIMSEEITTVIYAAYGKRKKCIIVDLDNTLWKGVIGEDGVDGIDMNPTGIGQVYRDIQSTLLAYRKTGILIAIVSKNNEADVLPVFERKSNMILKQEDFVTMRINWEPKSANIESIAKELNLGLDSFAFLDDNPAEQLEVNARLPMVEVISFPADVAELPATLAGWPSLQAFSLTEEDKTRTEMYAQENQREQLKKTVSMDEYLRGLKIRIKIDFDDIASIERITQLINKTNQFNMRTKRYTREQVEAMMRSNEFMVSSVRVWDAFGELGLTGVIIIEKKGKEQFMDTCLLSCRILSRGIEHRFLAETLAKIPKDAIITAEYAPTPKNSLVENFLDDAGFPATTHEEGRKTYKLPASAYKPRNTDWITVEK